MEHLRFKVNLELSDQDEKFCGALIHVFAIYCRLQNLESIKIIHN